MRRKNFAALILPILILSQLVWAGTANAGQEYSSKYAINYDPDFNNTPSYWVNSTWNPSTDPADYWTKAENGITTLHYKANRTDWGNTEVYQGRKPAYKIEKPLRFQDYQYTEGSGSLRLQAKVKRDINPEWQGSPQSDKSLYPQANVGIYLWLEVEGWNYDKWYETSSLVVDLYFDSRHQDPTTHQTITAKIGESYPPGPTPYDQQIHAGYIIGTLPLNTWQEFNINVADYIDQTLQECRIRQITLPTNNLYIKFFGIYVDSFSATVQASFDYVLLKDTSYEDLLISLTDMNRRITEMNRTIAEMNDTIIAMNDTIARLNNTVKELQSEIEDIKTQYQDLNQKYTNLMYAFTATTIAFITAAAVYLTIRKTKKHS